MCFVCEIGRGNGIWNENTWSVSQHSYYKQSSCPSISTCPVCAGIQGLYFPWPLGAVGYQVREGCTEPLIPCPCVHIVVAWELGRSCRLDGRESAELNSPFSCLSHSLVSSLRSRVIMWLQTADRSLLDSVECGLCWAWPGTDIHFLTIPPAPRPWSASDSRKPLPL